MYPPRDRTKEAPQKPNETHQCILAGFLWLAWAVVNFLGSRVVVGVINVETAVVCWVEAIVIQAGASKKQRNWLKGGFFAILVATYLLSLYLGK